MRSDNRIPMVLAGLLWAALAVFGAGAQAQEQVGGDLFQSGADVTFTENAARDALVSGLSVTLDADVAGDGYVTGFDVDVEGAITGDLTAAGARVAIAGSVGKNVTANGAFVRLRKSSEVGGNVRLAGGMVRVDGTVDGSLSAVGSRVRLNGVVNGDARLTGANLRFGRDARVAGTLTYVAPEEIDIPESVAAADRIEFVQLVSHEGLSEMRDAARNPASMFWPSLFSALMGFVFSTLFFVVTAALLIALAPERFARTTALVTSYPGRALIAGFLALATLIGLVPVSAMTLVGIPLVPIVVLTIMVSWTLGYLIGAYALSQRLAGMFGFETDTMQMKLVVLAAGLTALALLHFIPFLGWMLNLLVVLLGLGAIGLKVWSRVLGSGVVTQPIEPPADDGAQQTDPETKPG